MVIRVVEGSEIAVSPRHRDLVASDHSLRPEPDGHQAGWWLEQLDDWHPGSRVSCFVPRSLPAACRLLHPWQDRAGHPVRREDVVEVVDVADRTDLAHRVGDIPPTRFPGAAQLATPARGHFLLRGPLEGALTPVSASSVSPDPASGIWWPANRAWLVHTETHFDWTFIAGTETLVHDLRRHRALEVLSTTHDAVANEVDPDAPHIG